MSITLLILFAILIIGSGIAIIATGYRKGYFGNGPSEDELDFRKDPKGPGY